MKVTAEFADGLRRQLEGRAIGDEFALTARARIVGADEVLIDVTGYTDPPVDEVLPGGLEVRLLLTHGVVVDPDA